MEKESMKGKEGSRERGKKKGGKVGWRKKGRKEGK